MNFGRLIKTAAFALLFSLSAMNSAAADALDNCRNILLSGTYTIKFENITPPAREAMHETFAMYSGNVEPPENPYTMYKPAAGIVTASGEDRYFEINTPLILQNVTVNKSSLGGIYGGIGGLLAKAIGNDDATESVYTSCTLIKNSEKFFYTRIKNENKVDYIGHKKGKVRAEKIKKGFKYEVAADFGDREMTRILNALLPDDKKVDGTVIYTRAGSGTLANGINYFDLKAVNPAENVIFDAIRYYFENGNLVKIEAGKYYKTKTGKLDGTRTIINIQEFSSEAEPEYLNLPAELKDVTKRNDGKEEAEK